MNETTNFESGAIRSGKSAIEKGESKFTPRFDLISPIGLRRVAEAYGEGAAKYPLGNWQKGIPESSLLQHALSHIYARMMGDTSEDHLGHAIWNLMTLCHFEEMRPDLLDLQPIREGNARSTRTIDEKITQDVMGCMAGAIDIIKNGGTFPGGLGETARPVSADAQSC